MYFQVEKIPVMNKFCTTAVDPITDENLPTSPSDPNNKTGAKVSVTVINNDRRKGAAKPPVGEHNAGFDSGLHDPISALSGSGYGATENRQTADNGPKTSAYFHTDQSIVICSHL